MLAQHLKPVGGSILTALCIFDARTLGLADGAAVTSWTDSSGAGLTATQATGTKQPAYRAAPTGFNGQPAVQFTGASSQFLATAAFTATGTWTMYAVASRNNATSGTYGIANMDDGNTKREFQFRYNATNADTIAWNTAGLATDSQPAGTGTHVISAVHATSSVETFVDGATNGPTAITGTIPATTTLSLHLGEATQSAAYLDGYLAYFAWYQGAHGTAQRQAIEAQLKAIWGTP